MKEIRVRDASAKHIGALAWGAAMNVLNVSWREEK